MRESKVRTAGLLIGLALTVMGCMGEVNVTVDFYRGGNWEAVTELWVPRETVAMAGGADQIETELDDLVREANEEDVRASWKRDERDGKLVYVVDMRGKDLDALSRTALEGADIAVEDRRGERVIHLSYYPGGLSFESQTLVVKGGEIIAGNGQMVDKRTMMWENPGYEIRATLTERSRFSAGRAFGILAGIVVAAGLTAGGIYLWQRNRTPAAAYCPWCGAQIPGEAQFCTQCGRSREG